LLYIKVNILFELCIYISVYAYYINYNNISLFFIVLLMFACMLISGFPSALIRMGENISSNSVDLDGVYKLLQICVVFLLMPYLGKKYLLGSLLIICLLTVVNGINRKKIYHQIQDSSIRFSTIIDKFSNQTTIELQKSKMLSQAWKTLFPFILLAIYDGNNIYVIMIIWFIIYSIEARIIFKLYKSLIEYAGGYDFKKKYIRAVIKYIAYGVLLIAVSIISPKNVISYLLMGLSTGTLVDYVHTQKNA